MFVVVLEISMYNLRSSAKSLALTEGLRWSVISLMNKLKSNYLNNCLAERRW